MNTISCASQKNSNQQETMNVTYHAQTRGAMEHIEISNNELQYKTYNTEKSITLSSSQLQQLKQELSKLNLEKMGDFTSPKEGRATDRAMHATLTIKSENNEYTSSQFDDNAPPKELENIIKLLKEFLQ
jgi:hypothetical protein